MLVAGRDPRPDGTGFARALPLHLEIARKACDKKNMRPAFLIASLLCLVLPAVAADDSRPTAEQLEFFEKEIRPILVGTNSNGGFGRNQLGGFGGATPQRSVTPSSILLAAATH